MIGQTTERWDAMLPVKGCTYCSRLIPASIQFLTFSMPKLIENQVVDN